MVTVEPVTAAIARGYDAEEASGSMVTEVAEYSCGAMLIEPGEMSVDTPNSSMTEAVKFTYGCEIGVPYNVMCRPSGSTGPIIMSAEMNWLDVVASMVTASPRTGPRTTIGNPPS